MEEFYSLLRKYNASNANDMLPEWTKIFIESNPPAYWNVLSKILNDYSKNKSVFEIGSGTGDILSLIRNLGFTNVTGIESDAQLAKVANQKIEYFFQKQDTVIHDRYPVKIPPPNILVQVNCVYFENHFTKPDYLNQLKSFYENAMPEIYLLEVVDDSFKEPSNAFPNFVRLSQEDIQATFAKKNIESFITYQFPMNTSTKRLYLIS